MNWLEPLRRLMKRQRANQLIIIFMSGFNGKQLQTIHLFSYVF